MTDQLFVNMAGQTDLIEAHIGQMGAGHEDGHGENVAERMFPPRENSVN